MKAEFHINKKGKKRGSLLVKGELTAQAAEAFKSQLSELLLDADRPEIEISLLGVTTIDVSALQLLYAARESLSPARALSIVWPENEVVDHLLSRTGFRLVFN